MKKEQVEGYPLSPQQKRLWQLQNGEYDAAYSAACSVQIDGDVDTERLRLAVAKVVTDNEILRTAFVRSAARTLPIQVIDERAAFAWEAHDLTGMSPSDTHRKREQIADRFRLQSIDVATGPRLRAALLIGGDLSCLLLAVPSLCADTSSMAVLVRELWSAYADRPEFSTNRPEPKKQYADLTQWQNELLEQVDSAARSFWCRQLDDVTFGRLTPGETVAEAGRFSPRECPLDIPDAIQTSIRDLATVTGTSIKAVWLAALQTLVYRTTGMTEFAVGVGSSGRDYDELKPVIGPLAKTVPMKCIVAGDRSFTDLVRETDSFLRRASEHHDFFGWDLFEKTQAGPPANSFLPLTFEYCHLGELEREEIANNDVQRPRLCSFTDISLTSQDDRHTIKLSLVEHSHGLSACWSYDQATIGKDTLSVVSRRFITLLASVSRQAEDVIGSVSVVDPEELRVLATFGRSTDVRGAEEFRCIHRVIEGRSRANGERVAIRWKGEVITYSELDDRANRLAGHLRTRGVGRNVLVGLCIDRCPDMIVGILGILKAGGAYLPLDPSYPRDRLAFMLDDSSVQIVVSRTGLEECLPLQQRELVRLDDASNAWKNSEYEKALGPEEVRLDDRAYVIYTSGSSGRPKGVAITHGNLASSTAARWSYYHNPLENYLLLSSFSFDSSVAGIFWTLSQGGALVLPEQGTESDPIAVASAIEEHSVTHVLGLPTMWDAILRHADTRTLVSLSDVVVAGEECPVDVVNRHVETLPDTNLFNEYGPTEATVWTTVHNCGSEPLSMSVPIGRPVDGAYVRILTQWMSPVPLEAAGELCIGGNGVAHGYLGRNDLTAERFVEDPFSSLASARLYRTGDRARFRPNGTIEFLGRLDEQIKLRGYRIELGEIEAALRAHESIQDCAAIAREGDPNDKMLVAYLVPLRGDRVTSDEWREFLGEHLPEHMVPSAFVYLDALPRMPNGKIDRVALAGLDITRSRHSKSGAPGTPVERFLASAWHELLEVRDINVNDDFFELGGNSIRAAIIGNKLQTALGESIHVAKLFRFSTIAALADHLESEYPAAVLRLAHGEHPSSGQQQTAAGAEGQPGEFYSREGTAPSIDGLTDLEVEVMLDELLSENRDER